MGDSAADTSSVTITDDSGSHDDSLLKSSASHFLATADINPYLAFKNIPFIQHRRQTLIHNENK